MYFKKNKEDNNMTYLIFNALFSNKLFVDLQIYGSIQPKRACVKAGS